MSHAEPASVVRYEEKNLQIVRVGLLDRFNFLTYNLDKPAPTTFDLLRTYTLKSYILLDAIADRVAVYCYIVNDCERTDSTGGLHGQGSLTADLRARVARYKEMILQQIWSNFAEPHAYRI